MTVAFSKRIPGVSEMNEPCYVRLVGVYEVVPSGPSSFFRSTTTGLMLAWERFRKRYPQRAKQERRISYPRPERQPHPGAVTPRPTPPARSGVLRPPLLRDDCDRVKNWQPR